MSMQNDDSHGVFLYWLAHFYLFSTVSTIKIKLDINQVPKALLHVRVLDLVHNNIMNNGR